MKVLSRSCGVEGCFGDIKAKGLCNMHYKREVSHGEAGECARRRTENRVGTVNAGGYRVFNYGAGGMAYEHRQVMEKSLGRKLTRNEQVHHIDRNKLNNDISNLEVIINSDHQKMHAGEKALSACGHEDWRKCCYCHEYSSVDDMEKHSKTSMCHSECRRKKRRESYHARKNLILETV